MIVLINLDVPKRIFYKELTIGEDMNHPTANELRIGQYQNLLKTNYERDIDIFSKTSCASHHQHW